MKYITPVILLLSSLLIPVSGRDIARAAPNHVVQSYGGLPVTFEANRGQTDGQVVFISHAKQYTLFLTHTEAVFNLDTTGSSAIRMGYIGGNKNAQVVGQSQLPGLVNYFIGKDPTRWHTDIPTYARVEYQNVYPHTDLVYYSKRQQMEYDWVLHPGSRPENIRLQVEGARSMHVDAQGNLALNGLKGRIVQQAPRAYQSIGSATQAIDARFVLEGRNRVGIEVGKYDTRRSLVIDPVLTYATYLGGKQADTGFSVAIDGQGSAYVTGDTVSSDFPVKNALSPKLHGTTRGDGFIAKFNPSGTDLMYSTYIGGSDYDQLYSIAIDSSGDAYIAGETISKDVPVIHAIQATFAGGGSDGYVAELNARGDALLFSSYIGGTDQDVIYGIGLDSARNIYLAGNTQSTDFPTTNAIQSAEAGGPDGWVMKITSAGTVAYSTYVGGTQLDSASGLAVDAAGNAYVVGQTQSADFPVANAAYPALIGTTDAFVLKLDPTGQHLLYSTHLGGSDTTVGEAIAIDASGNAFVTGQTSSSNYPSVNAFQPKYGGADGSFFYGDAFVTKLDTAGKVAYSTYLGGSKDEEGRAIAVDGGGNAYITGQTSSADFPLRDAVQPAFIGQGCRTESCSDAFVTKLDVAGHLSFSTYLGGSLNDIGAGVAVDTSGAIYVVGTTESRDIQLVAALQSKNTSTKVAATDAFVAKIAPGKTVLDHSVVIDRIQIMHKDKGKMTPTTSVRVGEKVQFVAAYHDTHKGTQKPLGALVVSRSGKEIVQSAMDNAGTASKPDVRTLVVFKGSKQTGSMSATFSLIRGSASAIKTVKFTVRAH
jgi:hypothetical protein